MRTALSIAILLGSLAAVACGNRGRPGSQLLQPGKLNEQAPAVFAVKFTSSKGDFVVEVQREWAPMGADRFYNLVRGGFYDGVKFFRTVRGFMVQFGINGDPAVSRAWQDAVISDDPVKQSNLRGFVTFATAGPNSRTTQVFINFVDNTRLDPLGFAPFGKVVSGMEVVDGVIEGDVIEKVEVVGS